METGYKAIILERKEGVATITLNRPERMSAVDPRTRKTAVSV